MSTETRQPTLKARINRDHVTATAVSADTNPNMTDMPAGSSHWRVTLHRKGRQVTVPYSMGPAHSHEPIAEEVLECLLSDYIVSNYGFERWCDDFGLDTDSRKAERIFNTCLRQSAKLEMFFGTDLDAYVYDTER